MKKAWQGVAVAIGLSAAAFASASAQTRQAPPPANVQVLYFGAEWCAPCRVLRPAFERMRENGWAVTVHEQTEDRRTPEAYGIREWPTAIVYRNGQCVNAFVPGVLIYRQGEEARAEPVENTEERLVRNIQDILAGNENAGGLRPCTARMRAMVPGR